ncbi:MAG: dTDP-4-dehydrorhamnose reductase [Bacteroidales bacterium]|nr:dTDP-4-dehydrorhamnose reductase [Bacteroidales bacterium]
MNVLVTGGSGQLGRVLMDVTKYSEHRFIYTYFSSEACGDMVRLDITDRAAVEKVVKDHSIDVIVNCAGYTDVERAESEEDKAFKINAEAVAVLAEAAKSADAVLIHISTDYVFDGNRSEPYDEDVAPAPLSAYGRSKFAGELAVLASGVRYFIIRTSWLYSSYGRNFVKTILTKSALLPLLKVVSDQVGTPTYAGDLAEFILTLLEPGNLSKTGIYNYTNEGVCSWYDLACEVCELSGNLCEVTPCKTEEFPVKAARPHYSVLDKSKVKVTFGIGVPYWKDSLRFCLAEMTDSVSM